MGNLLTRTAPGAWTPPTATPTYSWQRCGTSCSNTGQAGETYQITDQDVGLRLRLKVTVLDPATGLTGTWHSQPTAAVELPPQPPSDPAPPPASAPAPAAPGEPARPGTPFTFVGTSPDPDPLTAKGDVAAETRNSPRLLTYFPVVRIRGFLTTSGVRVQVLSIRAPKNVRITIRCEGNGCPRRKWAHSVALVRARAFEASLPAGVRLVITVRRSGNWVGKYTTIRIHRGKAPTRVDQCLYPGSSKPAACRTA